MAVQNDGRALEGVSDRLKDNKEIVKIAVQNEGVALRYASDRLKNDVEIVKDAISNDYHAIDFIGEEARNNKDVLLTAIENEIIGYRPYSDGGYESYVLTFFNKKFCSDREVMMAAIKSNYSSIRFIDESLKNDKEIFKLAIENCTIKHWEKENLDSCTVDYYRTPIILEYAGDEIKNDKEIVELAISKDKENVKFVGENL